MLKIQNTLSKKKETFTPIKKSYVGLYTCGPTVYDRAHIGNLRTFVFEDILRRTLEYDGYKVKQVMNITDVEDKIIKRFLKEKKKNISEITKPNTKRFLEDMDELNIEHSEAYPLVTENIDAIISVIKKLIKNGFAYKGDDGSVYFDISKFKKYGKLARIKKVDIKVGARVSADEYGKTEAQDFVLWKSRKGNEPFWKSPFGEGRPGWHIECSALSMKYLGPTFDIHAGGVDLIFPHHDNEIAQSEGATGKKFVNYWVHGEHLLVNGKKMAKSLKNFYTLDDIKKKGFLPIAFRYFTLSAHYRSKLNFTWDALGAAQNTLVNLYREFAYFGFVSNGKKIQTESGEYKKYRKEFLEAVNDDINMPKALSILWRVIGDTLLSGHQKRELLLDFDKVLGLNMGFADELAIPPANVVKLVDQREEKRIHKQFVKADALRDKIEDLEYLIEDTHYGPFVWPKKI